MLTVENTGDTLTPQLVSTLTEPFQRGTERIRSDHAGVGLGLAIVKSITPAHDGTLTLIPRPAGGLCVWVRLPARRISITLADPSSASWLRAVAAGGRSATSRLSSVRFAAAAVPIRVTAARSTRPAASSRRGRGAGDSRALARSATNPSVAARATPGARARRRRPRQCGLGQRGPGEGACGEAPVAHLGRGRFVRLAFDGQADPAGGRPQQRVGGGGELGQLDVQVMVSGEVRGLVRERTTRRSSAESARSIAVETTIRPLIPAGGWPGRCPGRAGSA